MDDARIWGSERALWTANPDQYRRTIDVACLMILPDAPFVFSGADAASEVAETPRWQGVEFSDQRVARPADGLIVIAYDVSARAGSDTYRARCTTTYRRLEHDDWRVVQHHQTPAPTPAV